MFLDLEKAVLQAVLKKLQIIAIFLQKTLYELNFLVYNNSTKQKYNIFTDILGPTHNIKTQIFLRGDL